MGTLSDADRSERIAALRYAASFGHAIANGLPKPFARRVRYLASNLLIEAIRLSMERVVMKTINQRDDWNDDKPEDFDWSNAKDRLAVIAGQEIAVVAQVFRSGDTSRERDIADGMRAALRIIAQHTNEDA